MTRSRLSLALLAVTFLIGAPVAKAQDGSILSAIFGTPGATSGSSSGGKRVEIDLSKQRLVAYQGNRVVLRTRISSGRTGNTPTGRYSAGPYKSATHFSSLYNNAPMPWSVQVTGNIFIHGYTDVPNHPASKGCIRVPISGWNPAKRLYKWIDVGTPIRITY